MYETVENHSDNLEYLRNTLFHEQGFGIWIYFILLNSYGCTTIFFFMQYIHLYVYIYIHMHDYILVWVCVLMKTWEPHLKYMVGA